MSVQSTTLSLFFTLFASLVSTSSVSAQLVAQSQVNGDVYIYGTPQNDSISIDPNGIGGITVHYQSTDSFSNVRNVICFTYGGDDNVNVFADLPGDLTIESGDGVDHIRIIQLNNSVSIVGNVNLVTGRQDDIVEIRGYTVGGALEIDSDWGWDTIDLIQSTIGGQLDIHTNRGSDTVTLDGCFFHSSSSVKLGNGSDILDIRGSHFTWPGSYFDGGNGVDLGQEVNGSSFAKGFFSLRFEVGNL